MEPQSGPRFEIPNALECWREMNRAKILYSLRQALGPSRQIWTGRGKLSLRTESRVLSTDILGGNDKGRFLHLSPSGDVWIGDEMFAAKHLQTGYLRSIHISAKEDSELEERVEEWCNAAPLSQLQEMYDSGRLPDGVLE